MIGQFFDTSWKVPETVSTHLKSAFRLIPIHPNEWNLLGIRWKSQHYMYVDMYLPLGFLVARLFLINSRMG